MGALAICCAPRTRTDYFHQGPLGHEARGMGDGRNAAEHLIVRKFGHDCAAFAGQHDLAAISGMWGMAGEERIAALQTVHDAGRNERVERSVHRDRCQAPFTGAGQPLKQVVSADSGM